MHRNSLIFHTQFRQSISRRADFVILMSCFLKLLTWKELSTFMAAENATVSTSIPHFTSEYATLKYRIKEEGLLIKKPQYAMVKLTLLFIVLALSISVLLF